MNVRENIKVALNSVRSNWLRAILTMLIIAFGIMALVGILTAIDTAIFSLNDNFSNMGANSFSISPKDEEGVSGNRGGRRSKRGEPITFRQAMEFKEKYEYPALVSVSFTGTGIAVAKYEDEQTNNNVRLVGVDENHFEIKGYKVEYGRPLTRTEVKNGSNVAVIGSDVVKVLFDGKSENALGKTISLNNVRYRVIGVLETKGSNLNDNADRVVMAPILNVKRYYGTADINYTLEVAVDSPEKMEAAEATAIGAMRNVRDLRVGEKNDFEFFKSDGLISILKENTFQLRMAAIGIGLVTLLGAAIGLMNIMLVSVTERTREIGICKALGATRRNILLQFLTEAVVICQLGGILGIMLGILIGNIVTFIMGGSFLIPWGWILLGVTVCLGVGLISGLYPAMKAAQLDPIESLRYE